MAGFSVSARISGEKLTKAQLKACQRNLPFELGKATVETVRMLEKFAKHKAPVRKQFPRGRTRQAIQGKVLSPLEGAVGTDQEEAMAIDQGSRPHKIRARNVNKLAIPIQDAKGRFTSRSNRTRSGRGRKTSAVQYKDAPGAPNKRHVDVAAVYVTEVNHPGSRPRPFLTPTAAIGDKVAKLNANKAVARAIAKARRIT